MAKIKDTSPQKQSGGPIIIGPTEEEREGLKRHCSCGARTTGGQECEECRKKRAGTLQRKTSGAAASRSPASAPPIVGKVLSQPGRALPGTARSHLESAFGRDFSRVRVHSDTMAAQSARAVAARAYTLGQHIVFDHGQYDTDSPAGMHLLAHELAHTVQQDGNSALQRSGDLTVAPATDALEREAEAAADRALRGESGGSPIAARVTAAVQRKSWGTIVNGKPEGVTGDDLGGGDPKISSEAEKYIVLQYKSDHSKNLLFTNHPRSSQLGNIEQQDKDDPFLKVVAQEFVSTKERAVAVKLPEKETQRVQAATGDPILDSATVREFRAVTLQPDILDFTTHEIYDVTTVREAPKKAKETIEDEYKEGLNNVYEKNNQGRPWDGGTTYEPDASKLRRLFKDSKNQDIEIRYDVTDFSTFKGVIVYQTFLVGPAAAPGSAATEKVTVIYRTGGGFQTAEFEVDPSRVVPGKKEYPLRDSGPVNQAAAQVFSPIVPTSYGKSAKKAEFLRAVYILKENEESREFLALRFEIDPETRRAKLPRNGEVHKVKLKKLSDADLALYLDDGGLHGEGPLHTQIPLLRQAPIKLQLSNEHLAAVLKGDASKTRPSIPGLRITQADLGVEFVPELSAKGTLGVAFGPDRRPLADASLTISADQDGLVADGKIDVHVPGIEKAQGDVTYRAGHLSGSFTITTDQLRGRIPGVTSASLTGGFNDQGVSLTGSVDLKLPPGDQPATLKVEKRDDHFVYTGEATFAVPGINPVKATVVYDGTRFTGTGETGFDIQGLHGTIKATYRDGAISGKGKAQIEKGRVKGEIGVTLNEDHTLTGEGTVTVQITDNLVGTVGVKLEKNRKVHVDGEIAFPKPIKLFDRFPRNPEDQNKELFNVEQSIPIPGLSIGIVNVVAHVGARLGVSYYVGPGELRDVKLAAGFDPLEETKNLAVHGHALLVIPAHAGVFLVLEGGLGLSAAGVAESTGNLTVRGDLGLDAVLSDQFDVDYRDGRFVADARAEIHAGLNLRLALGANVQAKVGIGPFKAGTRKDWELKAYAWNGPSFGVVFPIHYASNEPFQPPSFDQIQFERPKIDAGGLLGGIFGAARSTDTEKEPGA
jgi:hypothetical protein